jgi:hypothetical protein
MFGFFKKRRAIKSFVRDMGPALRQEFGKKPHYTAEEVRRVGSRVGSNSDYLPYAMCMFCAPGVFDSLYHGSHSYDSMREEVGSTYFGGDTSFDADTVIEAGETGGDSGWSGGGDGGGSDFGGGGDFGGGDGGGGD